MRIFCQFIVIFFILILISITSMAQRQEPRIVRISELEWTDLNPNRGKMSPRATNLWGDRTTPGAAGFLVKFTNGFESPSHLHNVAYRGIVISGLIHNDDPKAKYMWLPSGSFWTQPAGEVHITAANGKENLAYIEVENGPYLVKPESEAFDNGERPVNIDQSNLVWLSKPEIKWIEQEQVKVAFLWKREELSGFLVKIPATVDTKIISYGSSFHGVIIKGQPIHHEKALEVGSYFGSNTKINHISK